MKWYKHRICEKAKLNGDKSVVTLNSWCFISLPTTTENISTFSHGGLYALPDWKVWAKKKTQINCHSHEDIPQQLVN